MTSATHWRKDCNFRDEAIASRKAAKDARKAKKPRNGRANLASAGSEDSDEESEDDDAEHSDDDCGSCDEDQQASNELFKPGTSSLLDMGEINDSSALLAALATKVGKVSPEADPPAAATASPPEASGDGSTSDPPPLESTGAPSAAEPTPRPALMARSGSTTERFYVVCYGDGAGVYHGSWHAPDNVRTHSEGIRRTGNNPTHIGFDTIDAAVDWCVSHSVPTFFRGPRVPEASQFRGLPVRIGFELLLPSGPGDFGEHETVPSSPGYSASDDDEAAAAPATRSIALLGAERRRLESATAALAAAEAVRLAAERRDAAAEAARLAAEHAAAQRAANSCAQLAAAEAERLAVAYSVLGVFAYPSLSISRLIHQPCPWGR